jgi:SAM-dependent methyltransferase
MKKKYVHKDNSRLDTSPEEIVTFLLSFLKMNSVVDVGCGIGHWLVALKSKGTDDVLGIDGFHLDKSLFLLDQSQIRQFDLEQPFSLDRTFDLAICLEVAEHISPANAATLIESLTRLSDTILFSAAIPGQGGQNHINEQWPSYWQEKFAQFGFQLYDVIRPQIWWNTKIKSYYRQNIFIASRYPIILDKPLKVIDAVHPDLLLDKASKYITGAYGLNKTLKAWIKNKRG